MQSTAAFALQRAEMLMRAVERLSTARELSTVTEIVTSTLRALTGCDGATFVLREDELCFYVDEDAISPLWKGQKFPLDACISGWAMNHRSPVVIPDIYVDDRIPIDAYRPTFVKSLCMVPIRSDDPLGALGSYWREEYSATPDDIRIIQVLANSAAIALENLELKGQVERRSTERDDLASRKDELESAIHILAHDLRNPLCAIIGFAQLLETQDDDPNSRLVYSRLIQDAGQQLADQIDRMLTLYRVTNHSITPVPVDLGAIARELADGLVESHPGRRIEFAIEDDLHAIADPVLSRLMLENLLSNAVKYTGRKPEARIELGCRKRAEPHSVFFVRDNGEGFPSDQAHRLFRPLVRLHSDSEFPGTGLGLASVARIVELHGGRVCAEGQKNAGATFSFTLPSLAA